MTEVSFYILPGAAEHRFAFACKIIEKAYKQGSFCNVLTESEVHSQLLDDLLWTFRQGSFIPHKIQQTPVCPELPQILISHTLACLPTTTGILVNLSSQFPANFAEYPRVLEIIANDPEIKQQGRNRYRQYQQLQANLVTHTL